MKLKKILAVILCLAMLLSLCACGKPTVLDILKDMVKAAEKTESYEGTMTLNMDMAMSVVLGEDSTESNVTMDMASDIQYADRILFADGTMTLDVDQLGQPATVDIIGYTAYEEDGMVSYSYDDGKWIKMTSGEGSYAGVSDLASIVHVFDSLGETGITLKDETEVFDGNEVYVLTASVSGDTLLAVAGTQMQDMLDSIIGGFADPESASDSLSDISADVTLKVYKETMLPAEIVYDFSDSMQRYIDTILESAVDSLESILSDSDVEIGITAEMKSVISSYTFTGYNNVGKLEIPSEALNAEEVVDMSSVGDLFGSVSDAENTAPADPELSGENTLSSPEQNEDGTYTLISSDGFTSVDISVPDGFEFNSKSTSDYIVFEDYADGKYAVIAFFFMAHNGDLNAAMDDYYAGYTDNLYNMGAEEIIDAGNMKARALDSDAVLRLVSYIFIDSDGVEYLCEDGNLFINYNNTQLLSIELYRENYDATVSELAQFAEDCIK